jgi:5-methyltetrahydrofolate--homocysteine methyltransferase
LQETVYPKFAEIKAKAIREKLLEAKLVYGYFPCQSEGNDLIIYQDDERTERMRFTFRASRSNSAAAKICVWRIISPRKIQGKIDVVAVSFRHDGTTRERIFRRTFQIDNYTDYLLFHGLIGRIGRSARRNVAQTHPRRTRHFAETTRPI